MKIFGSRFSILAILLLASSCDKDYFIVHGILGEWEWEKSVGGWGTITPKNSGEKRILKITPLNFREYVNNSLVLESQYEIVANDDRFYGSPQVLDLTNGDDYILTFSKSQLILDESYNPDAPIHYYKRR